MTGKRKNPIYLEITHPNSTDMIILLKGILLKMNKKHYLKKWLSALEEKCQKTLQLWNDGFLHDRNRGKSGFTKNAKQASLARFRCMKRLTDPY